MRMCSRIPSAYELIIKDALNPWGAPQQPVSGPSIKQSKTHVVERNQIRSLIDIIEHRIVSGYEALSDLVELRIQRHGDNKDPVCCVCKNSNDSNE